MVDQNELHHTRLHICCISCVITGLAAFAGCGDRAQIIEGRAVTSGTVRLDGQPLPAGTVAFTSQEPPYVTAMTKIRAGGKYLTDRVPIGKSVVTVDTRSTLVGNPANYVAIPEKYRDPRESGLTVEIMPGENENVDFTLEK